MKTSDKIKIVKNYIGYCRVSTLQQKEDETIDKQIFDINNFFERNKETAILFKMYTHNGISGALPFSKRPNGEEILNLIKSDKIDGVVTPRLNRIARKNRLLLEFTELLETNKKELISLKENIYTSTPVGRAMLGMMNVFIQFDYENTIEQLQEGRQYAKDVKGVKMGRKRIEVSKGLKKQMIKWYEENKMGIYVIRRLLQTEDEIIRIKERYNKKLKQREKDITKMKKPLNISVGWVRNRLIEWGVKLREFGDSKI